MNLKKITLILLPLFLAVTIFISCVDEVNQNEVSSEITYQRQVQLENIYSNEIVLISKEFVLKTTDLKTAINNFSTSKTEASLLNAQKIWKQTLGLWKRLELYNIGNIENSFIHFEINRWPTNTENINLYIDGNNAIDEVFIASIGSSSKGLSALEYLLFSSENNNEVVSTFTDAENSDRRITYLNAVSQNLANKAITLNSLWKNEEASFLNATQNGIQGSQNQLTNAMITLIEEVIISKLGNPLGDRNGGNTTIEDFEAYRSKSSLFIIQEHLTALKRAYTGNFTTQSIHWGFDNYLTLINRENLDKKITDAFVKCQEKIERIQQPLSEEIIHNKQNVIDLQISFTDLLVLIKVDMANAIGATVTINDNDGD